MLLSEITLRLEVIIKVSVFSCIVIGLILELLQTEIVAVLPEASSKIILQVLYDLEAVGLDRVGYLFKVDNPKEEHANDDQKCWRKQVRI